MIKTFIFDLGNVIVSFDHGKIVQRFGEFCMYSPDEIFSKAISSEVVREYSVGAITTTEFYEAVIRELDISMSFEDFFQAWNCTFVPEPILPERIIKSLSEKYKLLVLSDTNEMHFDYIKENFPILDYIDDFILSHKVNVVKPSAEIFQAVVKIAGCKPEECFFVDDLQVNVEGAKRFGLNAMQFISAEQFEEELKIRNLI
ncbi:MAG TPA: HAD family phosphatase [Pyrinomonadaceae bacterium]|jgi:putative hydrolase of the HAD superfamily